MMLYRMPENCPDLGSNPFLSTDFTALKLATHLKRALESHWCCG